MFSLNRHLHYFLNRELSELYITVALRTFAMSLISIFIPLYLLSFGYSFVSVLTFYIIFCAFHSVLSFFAAKFSIKKGIKHSIALSMPFLILFYIMLYTLPTYSWPLELIALTAAAQNTLFWVSFHMDFTKFSAKKVRGKEFSILRIITSTLNVIGPIIGAVIISFISFHYLFIFVSALLLISFIPLFYSNEIKIKQGISMRKLIKVSTLKNFVVFIGSGAEYGAALVIWPLFVFLIVGTYLSLGIITSIATFISLITVYLVGRMCDSFSRRKLLKFGSVAHSVVWFFKAIVSTGPQIVLINSISGITNTFKEIPYNTMVYDKASKKNMVEFIVFREIGLHVGKILFFALIMLMIVLSRGLVLAGFASLAYLLF